MSDTKTSDKTVSQADATAALEGMPTDAQPAPQPAPQEASGPDLTVQDLNALKSIIDVASQRGAFKPNEMVTVGQAYNKLETFLEAVAKQQPAQGA
jgi:hypothetical protein